MQDKINEFLNEPLAQKVLFFNEMLTPSLIRAAYWLCLIAIVWNGLGHMFSGGFGNFVEGIVQIAVGSILARIGAELIMVLFKIHENLKQVAESSAIPILEKPTENSSTA
jgi:hypothetical protein